jgi:hypothetical protein
MSGRCSCSEHRLIRVAALTVGNCWAGHDPLSAPRRCPARNIGSAAMISSRSSALTMRAGHEMRSRLLPPASLPGSWPVQGEASGRPGRCRASWRTRMRTRCDPRSERGAGTTAVSSRTPLSSTVTLSPGSWPP